jgi:DNA segregation ATPase FtsK/SpoIIIE, S-DNA-T family
VVSALAVPLVVDLAAVRVGVRDDGGLWCVWLAGSHVLVAGVTGAGKGSVVWSLLRGVGPAIATGTVQVWAIDPKGGMELGPGRPLFARFAADDFDGMADLLDTAVAVMRARAGRLAGISRKHQATVDEPLIVVVIDELANLTAYLPDRKLRDRIAQSVSLLLTQGRAVGVVVVAALQDPRKEVIAFRNLFPTKIALRLDEPAQVTMILGDGARDQGARCDQIPDSLTGVGYVRIDGVREPIRVRAGWVTTPTSRRWPPPMRRRPPIGGRWRDGPLLRMVRRAGRCGRQLRHLRCWDCWDEGGRDMPHNLIFRVLHPRDDVAATNPTAHRADG